MGDIITANTLNSVWNLKKQINFQQRRLHDLEVMASSTTALLDGIPHSKPLTGKIERFVVLIDDCRRTIEQLFELIIQRKLELFALLHAQNLSESCARVLTYHYVDCLRHGDIAKLMNYTRNYIWKLHRQGLRTLGLTMEEMRNADSTPVNIDFSAEQKYNYTTNFS